MLVDTKVFWVQKAGLSPAEYEDAFCFLPRRKELVDNYRAAVADGATESSFAKEWARLLARSSCLGWLDNDHLFGSITILQRKWLTKVSKRRPLPWYAQEKLASGAFAAVVGLTIPREESPENPARIWNALAIGDSCLFHIREGELVCSFPLSESGAFNSSPTLLSSVASRNAGITQQVRFHQGTWQHGDEFLLMSDALAAWFLACWELRTDPLGWLNAAMESKLSFATFVEQQRHEDEGCRLKNDDVTLLKVSVFES